MSKTPVAVHPLGRRLSVAPRRTGYKHRPIIAVTHEGGVTEHGEVFDTPISLVQFAVEREPHLWVVSDAGWLLTIMREAWDDDLHAIVSVVTDPDMPTGMSITTTRLTRFIMREGDKRARKPMHMVWCPGDMSRAPFTETGHDHRSLLRYALDVRAWLQDVNLPIPTSVGGIGAALLRDARFWPHHRGRVPRATNDKVRTWLPGVYTELRAPTGKRFQAVSLDQRAAYHHAAQEVNTPDPTTLFARGYFASPEDAPIWASRDSETYTRTILEPGIVYVQYSARPKRKGEEWLPCIKPGRNRAALWTNEVPFCEAQGVYIEGIVAAWTSTEVDPGLPLYGKWALGEIDRADDYRRKWLKPVLHSTYGMLAARTRRLSVAMFAGKGEEQDVMVGSTFMRMRVREIGDMPSPTTNVATLGVLQAEIRRSTFDKVRALSSEGNRILAIKADGVLVDGRRMSFTMNDPRWKVEPRDNAVFLDTQSYISDQRDVLPGRDMRMRVEARRHADHIARTRAAVRASARRQDQELQRETCPTACGEGEGRPSDG